MSLVILDPPVAMNHKQAVKRATGWLRGSQRCPVVMAERRCNAANEQPDVTGWHGAGDSILIECKVSRSDFLADRDKAFRRFEDAGVGNYRYFAAPAGLLKPEDMPEGWGLLQINEYNCTVKVKPTFKQANKNAEVQMLVSAIRRLSLAATVFVQPEQLADEDSTDHG